MGKGSKIKAGYALALTAALAVCVVEFALADAPQAVRSQAEYILAWSLSPDWTDGEDALRARQVGMGDMIRLLAQLCGADERTLSLVEPGRDSPEPLSLCLSHALEPDAPASDMSQAWRIVSQHFGGHPEALTDEVLSHMAAAAHALDTGPYAQHIREATEHHLSAPSDPLASAAARLRLAYILVLELLDRQAAQEKEASALPPTPGPIPPPHPTEAPQPVPSPSPAGSPEPVPSATPAPTLMPSASPRPTGTPIPTASPVPSASPVPTAVPTQTPLHVHQWQDVTATVWGDAQGHETYVYHPAQTHEETVTYPEAGHYETVTHPAETHQEQIRHPAVTHQETVSHPEEGHYDTHTIVDKAPWQEQVKVIDQEGAWVSGVRVRCQCGAAFDSAAAYEAHYAQTVRTPDGLDHSAYTETPYTEKVGEVWHYETVTHPAETHEETVWVVDRPAWTETVTVTDTPAWTETVTVTDREAWQEQTWVVDTPARTEKVTVVDQAAWTETLWIEDAPAHWEMRVTGQSCPLCGAKK